MQNARRIIKYTIPITRSIVFAASGSRLSELVTVSCMEKKTKTENKNRF